MGLTIGQSLLKWLILFFNLLFWISGIVLIIAGAVCQTVYRPYLSFLDDEYFGAPVLLIVVGSVITIIAFFGCCGSAKESYCMLMTFAVLLGFIFVLEFAGGIAGYVQKGKITGYLENNMAKSIKQYNKTTGPAAVWDGLQMSSGCCGVRSYTDWKNSPTPPTVPESCCRVNSNETCSAAIRQNFPSLETDCSAVSANGTCPIYAEGCLSGLSNRLRDSIGIVAGVGVGIAFIQIIGIVLSCYLARRIRRGYSYAA
ncbi:putative CD63 antigen [Hypsibius exemplaris]|uniref:Tetraspanin n=1 Tax=Hypsibius exemplaris TaxID=2072580 RepID=A0A1W0X189_HYPEX|nr:putative CD63 antigen [Hypsibius exemplaris]